MPYSYNTDYPKKGAARSSGFMSPTKMQIGDGGRLMAGGNVMRKLNRADNGAISRIPGVAAMGKQATPFTPVSASKSPVFTLFGSESPEPQRPTFPALPAGVGVTPSNMDTETPSYAPQTMGAPSAPEPWTGAATMPASGVVQPGGAWEQGVDETASVAPEDPSRTKQREMEEAREEYWMRQRVGDDLGGSQDRLVAPDPWSLLGLPGEEGAPAEELDPMNELWEEGKAVYEGLESDYADELANTEEAADYEREREIMRASHLLGARGGSDSAAMIDAAASISHNINKWLEERKYEIGQDKEAAKLNWFEKLMGIGGKLADMDAEQMEDVCEAGYKRIEEQLASGEITQEEYDQAKDMIDDMWYAMRFNTTPGQHAAEGKEGGGNGDWSDEDYKNAVELAVGELGERAGAKAEDVSWLMNILREKGYSASTVKDMLDNVKDGLDWSALMERYKDAGGLPPVDDPLDEGLPGPSGAQRACEDAGGTWHAGVCYPANSDWSESSDNPDNQTDPDGVVWSSEGFEDHDELSCAKINGQWMNGKCYKKQKS